MMVAAAVHASPLERRPLICLVTDRRRLSPSAPPLRQIDDLVAFVAAGAAAGIDLIQIRERDLSDRTLMGVVTRCVRAMARASGRLVVNDRLDVALAAGAAGVHLRADSWPAGRIRPLVPVPFLIGQSMHAADALTDGSLLDYAVFGAILPTASKPVGHRSAGVDALANAVRRADVPVLAIGGLTVDRLPAVWRAGAEGIAGIGMFIDAARSRGDWAEGLRELVIRVRGSFDTPQGVV